MYKFIMMIFSYWEYSGTEKLKKVLKNVKKCGKFRRKKIKRNFFADIGNSQKVTANLLLPKFSAVMHESNSFQKLLK